MPSIRAILNEIKWTKDLSKAEIWYIHRGAPNDIMIISGADIIDIGRSFFETTTASIPFHRITKILYDGAVVFDRTQI
jgi:uncharacterized protein